MIGVVDVLHLKEIFEVKIARAKRERRLMIHADTPKMSVNYLGGKSFGMAHCSSLKLLDYFGRKSPGPEPISRRLKQS